MSPIDPNLDRAERHEVAYRLATDAPLAAAIDYTWQGLLMRFGPWIVLVFYLLGAIPGVKSPVDRFIDGQTAAMAAHNSSTTDQLAQNREVQKSLLFTLRALCERTQQTNRAPSCGRD